MMKTRAYSGGMIKAPVNPYGGIWGRIIERTM